MLGEGPLELNDPPLNRWPLLSVPFYVSHGVLILLAIFGIRRRKQKLEQTYLNPLTAAAQPQPDPEAT